MNKLMILMAAGCLATTPLFAAGQGDHSPPAQHDGQEFRMACTVPWRNLNLTEEQRKNMSAVVAEHHKAGCTAATEATFLAKAKGILTPDQFEKFKASYEQGPKMNM